MSATGHIFVSLEAKELNEKSSGIQDTKIWKKGYMKRTYNMKNNRRLLSNSLRLKGSHAFLSLRQVISFCRLMFLFLFLCLFAS